MRTRTRTVLAVALAVPVLAAVGVAAASSGSAPDVPQAAPVEPAVAPADWPAYHGDLAHSGYAAGLPAPGRLAKKWSAALDGVVQASPLVIGDTVVVATENNTVYGLTRATGAVRWKRHLATPVPLSSLPCGNISPVVGITGTPVYDPKSKRVFAVTSTPAGKSVRHTLVALDVASGTVVGQAPVDPPGSDPLVENQRGALGLSPQTGRVLITYGGHSGDCGDYHGYLVSARTTALTDQKVFRTGTGREAGMWQPSGPTVDGKGFAYVVAGNGDATAPPYDGSDSVNRVDPATGTSVSRFAPAGWAAENARDEDLGSAGAALVGQLVWVQGKTSTGYLLDKDALGGVGHPRTTITGACASQFGGPAVHGSVVIAPCTDGLRQITVHQDGTYDLDWRAPGNVVGSPVIGGGRVWSLDPTAGRLYSLDEATGRTKGSIDVGDTVRFATPALSGGLVLVPTTTGVTAVSGA